MGVEAGSHDANPARVLNSLKNGVKRDGTMPYETIQIPDVEEESTADRIDEDPPATRPAGARERRSRKKTAIGEPIRLVLCDLDPLMLDAWRVAFAGCRPVEIQQRQAVDAPTDAYVAYVALPAEEDPNPSPPGPESPSPAIPAPMEMGHSQAAGISVGAARVGQRFVIHLLARPGNPLGGYGVTTYRITRAVLDAIADLEEEHPGAIRSVALPDLRLPGKQVDAQDAAHQMRRAFEALLGVSGEG